MGWSTRKELSAAGITRAQIDAAIEQGRLMRVRRGHYCTPDVDVAVQRAVRVGGQLACVSELRRRGVWVLDGRELHIRVAPHAARLRRSSHECVLHWEPNRRSAGSTSQYVSAPDAVESAVTCLERRAAVAAVDSALHLGVIHRSDLDDLKSVLSEQGSRLLDLVDARAESGLESIVRVLAVDLGLRVRSQVKFPGIGRVDLLIQDWVVVEADGDAFHDEKVTTKDRRRDAALVALGYTVLRFRYAQVIYELESVALAVTEAVATHRRIQNSGKIAGRARARIDRMSFS